LIILLITNFNVISYICYLSGDAVWTRFKSIRTDIGKLKKDAKKGKSGSAPKKLTPLQQWKVRRYAFLEAYIKVRAGEEEMGKVSISHNEFVTMRAKTFFIIVNKAECVILKCNFICCVLLLPGAFHFHRTR